MTVLDKDAAKGTFEIKFEVGHPVAGLDDCRTLTHPGVRQLHAIAGLAEMYLLLIPSSQCVVFLNRCGSARFLKRFDIRSCKPEHANRARDVLHCLLAEIGKSYRKLVPNLLVCRPRNAYAAGLAKCLQTRRDIDAVAKNIVAVDDNVADVDSDSKYDFLFRENTGVALSHAALNVDRANNRIYHAGEFNQHPVSGGLNDAAVMFRYARINQFATVCLDRFKSPYFINAHQAAVANHICSQNRRKPTLHGFSYHF